MLNYSVAELRLYTYRGVKLEKAALDMGAVDPDTHRISLGLVYSIPVF